MVCILSVMIWLCWIAVLLLPNVEAQRDREDVTAPEDVNVTFLDGSGGSGDRDNDGRRFGRKNRPGFRGGRRFGKGRKGRLQGGDEAAADEEGNENGPAEEAPTEEEPDEQQDNPTALLFTAGAAPALNSIVPAIEPSTTAQGPATSLVLTTLFATEPTSTAEAFPEPQTVIPTIVGVPYVAPARSVNIQSLSAAFGPDPTPSSAPARPTEQLTVTTSMTVYVTETPLSLSTPIPAEQRSFPSSQATATPSLDLAPLPASSMKPLSSGQKAGLGIGIIFAILLIVGATASLLHRRRAQKLRKIETDSHTEDLVPPRNLALPGSLRPNNPHKEDISNPEWSIESAEKVSIVRAGSVKSVASHTRPSSPLPPPLQIGHLPSGPRLSGKMEGVKVLRMGMAVPDRRPDMVLAGMALRSNPPVSPSAFPSPPRANKTGSWPLPD